MSDWTERKTGTNGAWKKKEIKKGAWHESVLQRAAPLWGSVVQGLTGTGAIRSAVHIVSTFHTARAERTRETEK